MSMQRWPTSCTIIQCIAPKAFVTPTIRVPICASTHNTKCPSNKKMGSSYNEIESLHQGYTSTEYCVAQIKIIGTYKWFLPFPLLSTRFISHEHWKAVKPVFSIWANYHNPELYCSSNSPIPVSYSIPLLLLQDWTRKLLNPPFVIIGSDSPGKLLDHLLQPEPLFSLVCQ